MPASTLLSLGSINADFQMRLDYPPGSSAMLHAHEFVRLSGGKSSNTAFIASRFGHRSLLLGRVGDDLLAEQALSSLAASGVDISGVSQAPGQSTAVSIILVPPEGKKQVVLATNANDEWDDDAIERVVETIAKMTAPACLVVNCEIPAVVVRRAIGAARQQDIPVILDPSFAERVEADLYPLLHAITPNQAEAQTLLETTIDGFEDAAHAARQLHDRGVAIACVKLSGGGCTMASAEGTWYLPPGDIDPLDTTGAGDAFAGAFSVALLEERDVLEALTWGVAAANLAITYYGSQPGYRSREEIAAMAAELRPHLRELDV